MSRKKAVRIVIVLAAIIMLVIMFRRLVRPVIASPFTLEPVVRYGVDVPRVGIFARYGARWYSDSHARNHVYVLAVFKGGSIVAGQEVTHKIDAEELVTLLANTTTVRAFPRVSYQPPAHEWSIYLHQNRYIHVILRGGTGEMVLSARSLLGWRTHRSYIVFNSDAIESALERMVAGYEGRIREVQNAHSDHTNMLFVGTNIRCFHKCNGRE